MTIIAELLTILDDDWHRLRRGFGNRKAAGSQHFLDYRNEARKNVGAAKGIAAPAANLAHGVRNGRPSSGRPDCTGPAMRNVLGTTVSNLKMSAMS
jgi:hypothetical protein